MGYLVSQEVFSKEEGVTKSSRYYRVVIGACRSLFYREFEASMDGTYLSLQAKPGFHSSNAFVVLVHKAVVVIAKFLLRLQSLSSSRLAPKT